MTQWLLWLYLLDLTLLILHEMDSAYWKEWELFHLPGGEGGFLLIHLPVWVVALYGVLWVQAQTMGGYALALLVSVGGLTAFGLHTYFLRQGRPEFAPPVSRGILWGLLILSLGLLAVTLASLGGLR